jgi:hypothetical protein
VLASIAAGHFSAMNLGICVVRLQVAESRFLNNKLVEVVGFMENISRECNLNFTI